ncbi:MAG: PIN domain-containing protein, partial [Armatimonadota bacterium]|nr:PIN domain-containing protein [Armatimonadota bacterium]
PAIRRELLRVLRNAHTSAAFQQRVADLLTIAEEVVPVHSVRRVAADPEDDKFVECALAGGAHCLISNDIHLLSLEQVEGIPILKPLA